MSDRPRAHRLAGCASPYLRQHADNPVEWYPWGDEALERARVEDKPIFLSIGYSACHWCHVMERETFSDPASASLLNRLFVCVKVDREERPDLDAVYMAAVHAITGSGGWPLTAFLTPAGEPIFGGTYFPPERRWGRPSLTEVATSVATAWSQRRGELAAMARELVTALTSSQATAHEAVLDVDALRATFSARLAREHDPLHGGFGAAPKFPSPSRLFFLLGERGGEVEGMLTATLDGMAAGGMYDWVGGGFHRYSVDERWLVPHFEKMLYDNALLLRLYTQAAARLGQERWLAVARETADYLLREMQAPEGGFYAATDADSPGGEGQFFTWTRDEVRAALPARHADAVIAACGLDGPANCEGGRSVLRPAGPSAGRLPNGGDELDRLLAEARPLLRAARDARPRPALDDKRLTGWNGMAAWALAHLGALTSDQHTLAAARRAGRFLLERVQGALPVQRSWRDGVASGVETLEDVAWTIAGLLALFEADADPAWLATALSLADQRVPRYLSAEGAAFDTPEDGERLVVRPRNAADGATPSSAGVLAAALIRLAAIARRPDLRTRAERLVAAERGPLARHPEAHATLLEAAATLEQPPASVVIAGAPEWESTRALLMVARRHADPAWPLVHAPNWPPPEELLRLAPDLTDKQPAAAASAAAYVCRDGACLPPTDDPATLEQRLRG